MKALLNNYPEVGDIVVQVMWTRDDNPQIQLVFQSPEEFYARHIMARPTKLMKWAIKLWWRGAIRLVKYGKQPKPSFTTVAEELKI